MTQAASVATVISQPQATWGGGEGRKGGRLTHEVIIEGVQVSWDLYAHEFVGVSTLNLKICNSINFYYAHKQGKQYNKSLLLIRQAIPVLHCSSKMPSQQQLPWTCRIYNKEDKVILSHLFSTMKWKAEGIIV